MQVVPNSRAEIGQDCATKFQREPPPDEEAAYCDQQRISEVVVPLLSMSKSVLLCISTLLESGNHYSKMYEPQITKLGAIV